MKHLLMALALLMAVATQAQTYVWKNGRPIAADPDSITFVKPDLGLQVTEAQTNYTTDIRYVYLTSDYQGKPVWMSALLMLAPDQVASKHIGKMALCNRYTIARSDECPTSHTRSTPDLPEIGLSLGYAVVAADGEGFGETGDRLQTYCLAEANARTSIDALLAAREWLEREGYTLSDTIINYGYSQGGQTSVAALKLSQTEYRGRVRFMKTYAGAGPYDLSITYKQFLRWGKIAQPSVLPITIITFNELYDLGLKYDRVFKSPLSSNVKSWIISKKFDTDEQRELFGTDSIQYFMQPEYIDSTSAEVQNVLQVVDGVSLTKGWVPDANTDVTLMHSLNDDIVSSDNSVQMYRFFQSNGVTNARLDTTTLTADHTASGTSFAFKFMLDLMYW